MVGVPTIKTYVQNKSPNRKHNSATKQNLSVLKMAIPESME